MGVPYSDAWGMPVDMALDMLGISPYVTKSKPPAAPHNNYHDNHKPLPDTLITHAKPPTNSAATGTRKLVAARRKSTSKLQSNPTI